MLYCVLLNVLLIFGIPVYNLFKFNLDQSDKRFKSNFNIIIFVLLFGVITYKKSYNIINFYFKYFTFAKLIMIIEFYLNQNEQSTNYILIQIVFFYFSQIPFPQSDKNIHKIERVQEYNQIVSQKDTKTVKIIFLYIRQLDKCKSIFYSFNRFVKDVYTRFRFDNQLKFYRMDLYSHRAFKNLIQTQYELKYEHFPQILVFRKGQELLVYPKHQRDEPKLFTIDALYKVIDIQQFIN